MRKTHIFKAYEMSDEYLAMAAKALESGALAVVPTDTVYGLGTGAFCEESIGQIYRIKERPASTPLQILTDSWEAARRVGKFSAGAERLARKFWPGALTLVLPPAEAGKPLTRGFAGLGIRVPGNDFLVKLLGAMHSPMACTSANLHGQPVLTDEKRILETFDGKVDFIFLGGTLRPTASSVADLMGKNPVLLREGDVSRADLERAFGAPFDVK